MSENINAKNKIIFLPNVRASTRNNCEVEILYANIYVEIIHICIGTIHICNRVTWFSKSWLTLDNLKIVLQKKQQTNLVSMIHLK